VLRSDSQYVVKTMNLKWKRKQNVDLWEKLDAEIGLRPVKFEWVEGHAGDPLNEEADRNARAAAGTAAKTGRVHYHGLSIVEEHIDGPHAEAEAAASASASPNHTPTAAARAAVVHHPSQDENGSRIAHELTPLLRAGETIKRCDGCGRGFVSGRRAASHCSLAECQLKVRRPAHAQAALFKE
jgi:hypothetical protein